MRTQHPLLRWWVWGLASLFLFYEYFLRTSVSVIVVQLVDTFSVTTAAIGSLSAFYFYIYAPMQIPVGMLMDQFGARKLLTMAVTICGAGSILFGLAPHYWVAAAGRFMMGFGSAFAFIGMIYVSSHWFSGKQRALLIGLGNSAASLGSVVGEGPLAAAVNVVGWRWALFGTGVIGLGIALVMVVVMRQEISHFPVTSSPKDDTRTMWHNLMSVMRNGQSWLNGTVALLAYATTNAFAGLWGVPFLYHTHGMTQEMAGFAISMIFVGWIVGGPLVGWISDHLNTRRLVLRTCLGLAFVVLCPVIFITGLPTWIIYLLLFAVGLFSSGQLLNFSLAIEINPADAKGTATAFTNFLISGAGAGVQPLVGGLLVLLAPAVRTVEGLPIYTAADYQTALVVFPTMMLLAFILSFFIKPRPSPKLEKIRLET